MTKDLSVKAKTKESTGADLHGLGSGEDFLDKTPQAQATKEKHASWTLCKLKTCVYGR